MSMVQHRNGKHTLTFIDNTFTMNNTKLIPTSYYPDSDFDQDEKGNEYHCPLGKKLVDFADETHFSRIAMLASQHQSMCDTNP